MDSKISQLMKKLFIISMTLLLCVVSSCVCNSEKSIARKVDATMKRMSVRDKVAQLVVVQIDRNNNEAERSEQDSLVEMGLGGIIIMRGPVVPFMNRMNELQSKSKIPLIVCTDAEWGAAMRFYEYPDYPYQSQLTNIPDAEPLLYEMGLNVARELKDLNILVNFAPVADMAEEGDDNYHFRRFGPGIELVSNYCSAYMRGLQDGGVYACGKHFPGHGNVMIDSHVEMPVFDYTRAQMDSAYLAPFRRLIDDGVAFMMMGHHCIPSIDSAMIPMSISRKCVTDLLKDEMGFDGIVVTDALRMGGVANGRTPVEVMVSAYKAGVDMLLMPDTPIAGIEAIASMVESGELSIEELDSKVRKVLTLKAKAGLLDRFYSPRVENIPEKIEQARIRDFELIERMNAALAEVDTTSTKSEKQDGTLILDRGRD